MKDINYRLYKLLKLMCIVEKLALQKLQITNSGTTVKSTQQFTIKKKVVEYYSPSRSKINIQIPEHQLK